MTTKILRGKLIGIALTSLSIVGTCVTVLKASGRGQSSKRKTNSGHFPALRPTILKKTDDQ